MQLAQGNGRIMAGSWPDHGRIIPMHADAGSLYEYTAMPTRFNRWPDRDEYDWSRLEPRPTDELGVMTADHPRYSSYHQTRGLQRDGFELRVLS
jgi:hypothetical protein